MAKQFEIKKNTYAFAQNEDDMFIITNEQGLTFKNLDILNDMGALINTNVRTITPELPIGVLTKFVFPWKKPTIEVNFEDVKKFRRTR